MLKNKYQNLNREEKKKTRIGFYKTDLGKIQKPRFDRLLIISILLLIYSLYLIIEAIISNGSIFSYTASIIILTTSLVFYIGRKKILDKNMNDYLNKKNK